MNILETIIQGKMENGEGRYWQERRTQQQTTKRTRKVNEEKEVTDLNSNFTCLVWKDEPQGNNEKVSKIERVFDCTIYMVRIKIRDLSSLSNSLIMPMNIGINPSQI